MSKQESKQDRYVVIMAGGRGERFWPVSREKTPKQLIPLLGNRSFLQLACDLVKPVVPVENILVITNAVQAPQVRKQLPELPPANIVAEPCGRDTCAAVTLGAALVGARSESGVMAVIPADHIIPKSEPFQLVLNDAFEVASRKKSIVTIGIKPSEPATGYGYIHTGEALTLENGLKHCKTNFYNAISFVEKPSYEKAVEYVGSGQYRWNAGMFIWSYSSILAGLEQHQPSMGEACLRWKKAAKSGKLASLLAREYPELKKISIDYALLEKANNVVVANGDFEWDDVGSWSALSRHLIADPLGNCAVGDFVHVDAARNTIFDARKKNRTPIAVVGLQDVIVVQTDDATLVVHKSQAQKVKELVAKLKANPAHEKLI